METQNIETSTSLWEISEDNAILDVKHSKINSFEDGRWMNFKC